MPKLVILNQGMTGRTFDLNIERTTVGRVEDNTFQIADGSVSSHHAEILLHGPEILVKDLNSTNGSYINGEKITESVLKPGQVLRFGQVELKIDDGQPLSAAAPAPATGGSAPAPTPTAAAPAPSAATKKPVEATMVMPRGVSLTDLEHSGSRPAGFDSSTSFSKKNNKINKYFLIGGLVVGAIIVVLILVLIYKAGSAPR
jgi:pSer/pThr/pTyr-binding forkhead associated (FHA) protein